MLRSFLRPGQPRGLCFVRRSRMYLFLALFCGLWALPEAWAARQGNYLAPGMALPGGNDENWRKASAMAELSGSPWPGVIDHLLERRPSEASRSWPGVDININYPSFGHRKIDADIRQWVSEIADAYETNLYMAPRGSEGGSAELARYGLWGSYSVSRPSQNAVSVTFEIWNYSGTGDGNLDVLTLNYSLLTGQRLQFVDLFENPGEALSLMSSWSREQLAPRLGALRRARMLSDGTEPVAENFASITLGPKGVCINFQPWQVAPWDAGVQKVEMPLEKLLPASPLLAIWGR